MTNIKKKCGLILLSGFPNSGKSTLLNAIIKKKISIVSSKVQTTKDEIKGIVNYKNTQLIFSDTPGIVFSKKHQSKNLARSLTKNNDNIDLNIFIFDVLKKITENQIIHLTKIFNFYKKNFLVINKIDLVPRKNLLEISEKLNMFFNFKETFMISAKKNKDVKYLIKKISLHMPTRSWVYEKSIQTDKSIRFQVSEITREKIFQLLNKELPYSVQVETEIKDAGKLISIHQKILTDKDSQKSIIIGKSGKKIKEIGIRSRIDIEKLLKKKIYLDLIVLKKNN